MTFLKDIILQMFFAHMPFVMYNIFYRDQSRNYSKSFITLSSAICLFLSMTFGASVVHGYFYDIRYTIIFFGMIFGGLQTGFILLAEFLLYRLYIGGDGVFIAIVIMLMTFPGSYLLYRIYNQSEKRSLILLLAGVFFSITPLVAVYLENPVSIIDNLTFHMVVIPMQNLVGCWMLITLFRKAVIEKDLFISYAQNERVRAISHVAASLVHEVRNPLTAVKGFLTLIRDGVSDRGRIERYIEICMSEIARTEYILSEYLAISKPIGNKQEPTNLEELLRITKDVMSPYANMHNVLLEIGNPPEPVWILANPDKMKQVLVNFIKNAVEACAELPNTRGIVTLRLQVEARKVVLTIQDNGIGMTEEQAKRLGSIYFSTKSNGTGLGMTFSYQAILSFGGTVSVQSAPGAGTKFTISLPIYNRGEKAKEMDKG
ncbi:two-component system, sporulation sensor kinase B [Paenibacillus barengoltzii]|uniref:sensor histidine kinase n=1 Tax=Paenibacillus TaxID=44249 RepID=UPI00048BA96F|nr:MULTISPECIES: HAMP domain-containing sensor histidine kinase [Paenibacillus]SME98176.1 two-component system, sporulation sensor kinase B [Paenibacillus barengoltzii]